MGTLAFMAPEIFKNKGAEAVYKPAVDIWAAGVIMFHLFAGEMPFTFEEDDQEDEYFKQKVMNKMLDYKSYSRFKNASEEAYHLLDKMLEKDPSLRISAEDAI